MSVDIKLRGFDGYNLLAFLALLGLLTALVRSRQEWSPRASWVGVTPYLHIATEASRRQIAQAVLEGIIEIGYLMKFSPYKNLKLTHKEFSELQKQTPPVIMAVLGSDGAIDDNGTVQYPPLCTMFGGGHQNFLERLESATQVDNDEYTKTMEKIENVLFGKWDYKDQGSKITFRWDPKEYRPHAYRAKNPSNEKFSAIEGANRLAAVGFTNYWCAPAKDGLSTVACKRDGRSWMTFWPIWNRKLSLDAIRTLMYSRHIADIQDYKFPYNKKSDLSTIGVTQIMTADIFWDGKFRNVTWGKRIF